MGNTIPVDLERQRRNKMGRPMRKGNMGVGAGKIQVTSYRRVGEAESQTAGSIVSQRSTTKFNVNCNGTNEVLQLVNGTQGALAEGTFIVNAKDDGGTATQVTKFRNRTIQTEGGGNFPYTISDSNAATAAERTVDSQ